MSAIQHTSQCGAAEKTQLLRCMLMYLKTTVSVIQLCPPNQDTIQIQLTKHKKTKRQDQDKHESTIAYLAVKLLLFRIYLKDNNDAIDLSCSGLHVLVQKVWTTLRSLW